MFFLITVHGNVFLFQINVLKADKEVDKTGKDEFFPSNEGKMTSYIPVRRGQLLPSDLQSLENEVLLFVNPSITSR